MYEHKNAGMMRNDNKRCKQIHQYWKNGQPDRIKSENEKKS